MGISDVREKLNNKKLKKYIMPYLYWLVLASLIEAYYGSKVSKELRV